MPVFIIAPPIQGITVPVAVALSVMFVHHDVTHGENSHSWALVLSVATVWILWEILVFRLYASKSNGWP